MQAMTITFYYHQLSEVCLLIAGFYVPDDFATMKLHVGACPSHALRHFLISKHNKEQAVTQMRNRGMSRKCLVSQRTSKHNQYA